MSVHYPRHWRNFTAWCATNGGGIDPFHSTPGDICRYLLDLEMLAYARATIAQARAAIQKHLRTAGVTLPPTRDSTVDRVMRDIKARAAPQQGKDAIAVTMAFAILRACADGTLLGVRDRALLALGWALCMSLRRVVKLTVADIHFDPRRPGKMTVNRGKVPPLVITDRLPHWCPVRWLREWMTKAGIHDRFLFRAMSRGGHARAGGLRGHDAADRIKKRAARAGYDATNISAMSPRFGRIITEYMLGAKFTEIMKLADLRNADIPVQHIRRKRLRA